MSLTRGLEKVVCYFVSDSEVTILLTFLCELSFIASKMRNSHRHDIIFFCEDFNFLYSLLIIQIINISITITANNICEWV